MYAVLLWRNAHNIEQQHSIMFFFELTSILDGIVSFNLHTKLYSILNVLNCSFFWLVMTMCRLKEAGES